MRSCVPIVLGVRRVFLRERMNKVYVVTSGQYSDYGIKAVFSTKEKAEEYIKLSTDPDINNLLEEFELDIPKEEWLYTKVIMDRDGHVLKTMLTTDPPGFAAFVDEYDKTIWQEKTPDRKSVV